VTEYLKGIVREVEIELRKRVEEGNKDKDEDEKNALPNLLFTDATIEALMDVLSRNPRGLWGCFDELSAWLNSFVRYNANSTLSRWLSLYNGGYDGIFRKGDGESSVPWGGTSIVGNITPDAGFTAVVNSAGDGMAERFAYTYPDDLEGRDIPTISSAEVRKLTETLKRALRKLRDLNTDPTEEDYVFDPTTVKLTEAAMDRFALNYSELKARKGEDFLRRWANKSAGRILRVALVFKFLEWALLGTGNKPGRIDEETIEKAARFVNEYCEGMARKVSRNIVLDDAAGIAVRTVKLIKSQKFEEGKLTRFIRNHFAKCQEQPGLVEKVIAVLEEKNYVRPKTQAKAGTMGAPRKEWEVNPQVFAE
jgi:hypothetical protein